MNKNGLKDPGPEQKKKELSPITTSLACQAAHERTHIAGDTIHTVVIERRIYPLTSHDG